MVIPMYSQWFRQCFGYKQSNIPARTSSSEVFNQIMRILGKVKALTPNLRNVCAGKPLISNKKGGGASY